MVQHIPNQPRRNGKVVRLKVNPRDESIAKLRKGNLEYRLSVLWNSEIYKRKERRIADWMVKEIHPEELTG